MRTARQRSVAVALVSSGPVVTIALEECDRRAGRLGPQSRAVGLARIEQAAAPPSAEKQGLRTDGHDAERPAARPVAQVARSGSRPAARSPPALGRAAVLRADGGEAAEIVPIQNRRRGRTALLHLGAGRSSGFGRSGSLSLSCITRRGTVRGGRRTPDQSRQLCLRVEQVRATLAWSFPTGGDGHGRSAPSGNCPSRVSGAADDAGEPLAACALAERVGSDLWAGISILWWWGAGRLERLSQRGFPRIRLAGWRLSRQVTGRPRRS